MFCGKCTKLVPKLAPWRNSTLCFDCYSQDYPGEELIAIEINEFNVPFLPYTKNRFLVRKEDVEQNLVRIMREELQVKEEKWIRGVIDRYWEHINMYRFTKFANVMLVVVVLYP
jgi:hypothetical protein